MRLQTALRTLPRRRTRRSAIPGADSAVRAPYTTVDGNDSADHR